MINKTSKMEAEMNGFRVCPRCGGNIDGLFPIPVHPPVSEVFKLFSFEYVLNFIGSERLEKKIRCQCGYNWTFFDEYKEWIETIFKIYDKEKQELLKAERINNSGNSERGETSPDTIIGCDNYFKCFQTIRSRAEAECGITSSDPSVWMGRIWYSYYKEVQLCLTMLSDYNSNRSLFIFNEESGLNTYKVIKNQGLLAIKKCEYYIDDHPLRQALQAEMNADIINLDSDKYPWILPDVFKTLLGAFSMNNEDNYVRILSKIQDVRDRMIDSWASTRKSNDSIGFTKKVSYGHRKVIFISESIEEVAGFFDSTNSISYIFPLDCLPPDIIFPFGRPTSDTLYIANPVKPDEYILYDNHEQILFMDKINELEVLLTCLGATEITFTSTQGMTVEQAEQHDWEAKGKGRAKGVKGDVTVNQEKNQEKSIINDEKVERSKTFDPLRVPYVPNELYWFKYERAWQQLAKQRLEGNMLTFAISVSTKNIDSLSESDKLNISIAVDSLAAKISANYNKKCSIQQKTTVETTWRITAKFKSLNEWPELNELNASKK